MQDAMHAHHKHVAKGFQRLVVVAVAHRPGVGAEPVALHRRARDIVVQVDEDVAP